MARSLSSGPGGRAADVFLVTLAALLAGALFISTRVLNQGVFLFPIDDAYIYLQYALRFAQGHPFSYGAGEPPSTGMTSLLYPLVVSLGAFAGLDGDRLPVFVFILGASFLAGSAIFARRLLRRAYSAPIATGSAALLLLSGPFLWGALSGMEIAMTAFVFFATADVLVVEIGRGRLRLAPVGLALLVLARPEAMLFALLVTASLLVRPPLAATGERLHGRMWLLAPFAAELALLGVNLFLTGRLSPDSARPKSPLFTPYYSLKFHVALFADFLGTCLKGLATGAVVPRATPGAAAVPAALHYVPPLAILFWLVAAADGFTEERRARRTGPHTLLVGWFVIGLLGVAFVSASPNHHFRYLLPFLPAFVVLLLPGAARLTARMFGDLRRPAARATVGLLATAIFAFQVVTAVEFGELYGRESRGFLELREAALWIRGHVPDGVRIAVLDVGIVGYYSDHVLVDLLGLTTATLAPSSVYFADYAGSKYEALESWPAPARPRYFLVHRVRFDDHGDEAHLDPLRSRPVKIFGPAPWGVPALGRQLTLWEIDWNRLAPSPLPCTHEAEAAIRSLAVLDSVNTADVNSERAHGWRLLPRTDGEFGSNRIVVAGCDETRSAADGARGILGSEVFSFEIETVRPVVLVTRMIGARGPVSVEANGEPVGTLTADRPRGFWSEPTLVVPPEKLRAGRNVFRLSGEYLDARNWVFGGPVDVVGPLPSPRGR